MFVIRFVLSFFVLFFVRRFTPDWLTVHRFLQPSRGEVTKHVKRSWTRGRNDRLQMSPRDRLRGAFGSAPAERSGDGGLALGQSLAPRAKAESRFACLRTPNRGRLDGICIPSGDLHRKATK